MSFTLPKSSFDIFNITISSSDVSLICWSENWNAVNISICFPKYLLECMKILSNGILCSIPKANAFHQTVTYRIIWYWETHFIERERIWTLHLWKRNICNSWNSWDIHLISCVYLRNCKASFVFSLIIFLQMSLNFLEIDIWQPAISVHDC